MKRFLMLPSALLILATVMCSKDNDESENVLVTAVQVLLDATGPRYEGSFYPAALQVTSDYAIWLEDAGRNYVKTLKITPVAVTVDSAHGSHIEHLPNWAEAAGLTYADLQAETEDGLPPSMDGLTGASPFFESDTSEQTITANWDLTDAAGRRVDSNVFYCCAEVANIIKDGDSASGTVDRFDIVSETLAMRIDLGSRTYATEEPTENLKDMTAVFNTGEVAKTIVGP